MGKEVGFSVFGRLGPLLRDRLQLTIVSLLVDIRRTSFICVHRRAGTATKGLDIRLSGLDGTNCIRVAGAFGKGVPYALYEVAPRKISTFRRCVRTLGSCLIKGL